MVSMVTVTHLVTSSFWGLKKITIFLLPRNYYPIPPEGEWDFVFVWFHLRYYYYRRSSSSS